jgi:porin
VLVNSTFSWPGLANVNLAFGDPTEFLSMPVARVAVQPTDSFRVLGAVFRGTTRELRGTLAVGEAQYSTVQLLGANFPSTYRVGVIYQSGSFADPFFPDWMHRNTSSAYLGMDQMVWRKRDTEDQGIGVFARVMVADKHSLTDLYLDGGVNWKGPIAGRPDDVFGMGVSYLRASKEARNQAAALFAAEETVRPLPSYQLILEATYLMQLTGWLQVQPDIQYIIQPDAQIPTTEQSAPLKNSLVVGLRAIISF